MSTGMYLEGTIVGNRIPKDYVMTKGYGDTDVGAGKKDPWEVGSFDIAQIRAGVENFNFVRYTSIIPPEATEVPIQIARTHFHHGAVMEAIIAQANGHKGERICAGVGRILVRRNIDGLKIGGFAAEYMGDGNEDDARRELHIALTEIFNRRYDTTQYSIFNEKFCVQEHVVRHRYGTAIALIGFVSYIYPVLGRF